MNVIDHVKRTFNGFGRTTKIVALSAVFLGVAAAGTASFGSTGADAASCTNNDIIKCGATTPADFIAKTNANSTGDLPTIYADYGLVGNEYGRFVATAKMGTAYRDGRIVVDGQTVATDTSSIGRTGFSYSHVKSIGGKTYYESKTTQVQKSDIPVMVMFNADGVMEFAVLTACANPINGNPVTPSYSCDKLNTTPVPGKLNTYSFTTNASAANNAQITKVVYDFGDGTKVEKTNPAEAVEHTYTKENTYTAKVTVYVKIPGSEKTAESAACATKIEVKIPYYECIQLTGAILNKDKYQYAFTASLNFGNGATFSKATFDYGDNAKDENLKLNADGKTITQNHSYPKAGTYTTTATIYFNVNNEVKTITCSAQVTPEEVVSYCRPGIPVGDARCAKCIYNGEIYADDANCKETPVTPPELPNTGAGNMIGIFAGVSSLATAAHFFLKRRMAQL